MLRCKTRGEKPSHANDTIVFRLVDLLASLANPLSSYCRIRLSQEENG